MAVGKLKRRAEKEVEGQRQLALERLNQKHVKEGGRNLSYMDLMKTRAIKVGPGEMAHVRGACDAEKQRVLEQETIQNEPQIKLEPEIRTEED